MNPAPKRDLDAMRSVGDQELDAAIMAYVRVQGRNAVGALIGTLFRSKGMPEEHALAAAIPKVRREDLGDFTLIERGQALFELFGPEMLLILGSYSLPLAFAAGKGVQTVYRARRLKEDPIRRLCDTAQMVVNVMRQGELEPGRVGWESARKVRLIHALIRHWVVTDPERPWVAEWGVPINQEDLLGTLLSFTVAVLQGLRRMGARISSEDADAYVAAWAAVGRVLGIAEDLLPVDEADGQALARRIGERQFHATPEGKELNDELLMAVGSLFKVPGYATSLAHFFLKDSVFGADVAAILRLPAPNWTKLLVDARAWQKRAILPWIDKVPGAHGRRSFVARHLTQAMIRLERPGGATVFDVPSGFSQRWKVASHGGR